MRGNNENPGIILLAIDDVFNYIQKHPSLDFLLRVSYIEIYNELITDLLNPSNTNLKIHEDVERGVFVGGVTEEIVTSSFQMLGILARGDANRKVGGTKMNQFSSRSHSIFRMVIESSEKDSQHSTKHGHARLSVPVPGGRTKAHPSSSMAGGKNCVKVSLLNLVDLAGSERAQQTGAEGIRLKEGAHINKSLLTLERVISKLSEGKSVLHVPYRDSRLTRILQPALGGNSRTAIICNITPAWIHQEESHSTLKFASSAKKIQNKPIVNEVVDDKALLARYKTKISSLEEEVETLKRLRDTAPTTPVCLSPAHTASTNTTAPTSPMRSPASSDELIRRREELSQLSDGIISATKLKKASKSRRQTWCPGPSLSTAEVEHILAEPRLGAPMRSSSEDLISLGDDEFDLMISSNARAAMMRSSSDLGLLTPMIASEPLETQISALEADLKLHQQLLAEAKEALLQVQEENVRLESLSNEGLQDILISLQAENSAISASLEEKQAALSGAEANTQVYAQRLSELESSLQIAADRCNHLEGLAQTSEANLEEQLHLLTEEHILAEEKLNEELDGLRTELDAVRASNASSSLGAERAEELESVLLDQQILINAQNTEIEQLRATESAAQAALAESESKYSDVCEQLKLAEASLEASRDKSAAFEAELVLSIETQAKLETETSQALSKAAEVQTQLESIQVEFGALEVERDLAKEALDEERAALESLSTEHSESVQQNAVLQAEAEGLKSQWEATTAKLSELEDEIARFKESSGLTHGVDLGSVQAHYEAKIAELNNNLTSEKSTMRESSSALALQVQQLEARADVAKSEHASLENQVAASLQEAETARSDADELRQSLQLLQTQSRSAGSQHEQTGADLDLWRKKASQLQTALDLTEQSSYRLESALEEHKTENKRLMASLSAAERQADELGMANAKLEQLRKQVSSLSNAGQHAEEVSQRYETQISELQLEVSRSKSSVQRVTALEAENRDILRELSSLKTERAASAELSSSAGSKHKSLQAEIDSLEQKLRSAAMSLGDSEAARTEAEERAKATKRDLEMLRAQFESVVTRHKAEKKALAESEAELQAQLRAVGAEEGETHAELETLREENKRLDSQLTAYSQQMDVWRAHSTETSQRIAAAAQEKTAIERQLAETSEQANLLRIEVDELSSREKLLLKRHDAELRSVSEELGAMKKDAKAVGQQRSAMEREKESGARDLEKLKEKLTKEHNRVQLLTTEKSSLMQEKVIQERELKTAKAALANLESVMKKTEGAGSKSDAKLKELQSIHGQLEKKAAETVKQLLASERQSETLSTDLQKIKAEADKFKADLDKLRQDYEKTKNDAREAQLELDRTAMHLAESKNECVSLQEMRQNLEATVLQLETEAEAQEQVLDDTRMQYNTAINELQTSADRVSALQGEIDALQSEMTKIQTELSGALAEQEAQVIQLNEALVETSMEKEEAKAASAEAWDEATKLTDELQTRTDELDAANARMEEQAKFVEDLKSELQALGGERDALVLEKQTIENLAAETESRLSDLNAQHTELLAQYSTVQEQCAALEAAIEASESEKKMIGDNLGSTEEKYCALESEKEAMYAELCAAIESSKSDLAALQAEKDSTLDSLTKAEALCSAAQHELSAVSQALETATVEKSELDQRSEALANSVAELEKELDLASEAHLVDQDKINQLTALSEETVAGMEEMAKELETARAETLLFEEQLAQAKAALEAAHNDASDNATRLESMKLQLSQTETAFHAQREQDLASTAESQAADSERSDALIARIADLEGSMTQLEALRAQFEDANVVLGEKVKDLESRLESQKTELLEAQSAAEELKAQSDELMEAVEHYKSEESNAGEMMQSQESILTATKAKLAEAELEVKTYKVGYAKKKAQLEQMKTKFEDEVNKLRQQIKSAASSKTPSAAQLADANKENAAQALTL